MTDTRKLLSEYADDGSEPAFRELVARYVNLVYSTARRLVGGDPHLAQDVTQIVFTDLARKARSLSPEVMLGGWLHQRAFHVATTLIRADRRRQDRERRAAEMNLLQEPSGNSLAQITPFLDEAIIELNAEDRKAILLRFFEQREFRLVGEAMGVNEDAARMRVNRALEKLHSLLRRRGVALSATALGTVLTTDAVTAAPAGLALTVSTAALAGTAVSTATVVATTAKTIAMTTLQKTFVTATVAVLAGAGLYQAHQASQLRDQVQTLQQQLAPLAEQIQQLQRERDETKDQLALTQTENQQLRSSQNASELLRLKNEVTQLRAIRPPSMSSAAGGSLDPNDPAVQHFLEARAVAEKISRYLEQMPDKNIPELKLLTDEDWLGVTRDAKFDTDANVRKTLSKLRTEGKQRMFMGSALYSFTHANNGQLPTDIAQLKPWFKSALNNHGSIVDDTTLDAIFRRYELLHTGNVNDFAPQTWFVAEKAPVDKDYDSRAKFGIGTSTIVATGIGEAGDPDDKSY